MKYWAYIKNEILGPYAKDKLFEISDFNPTTLICPQTPVGEKTEDWKEASGYPEISALLNSPKAATIKKEEVKEEEPQINKTSGDETASQNEAIEKEPQVNKTSGDETASQNEAIEKEPQVNKNPDEKAQESPSLNQLKPQPLSAAPLGSDDSSSMAPQDNFEVNKLSSIKEDGEKKEEPAQENVPEKQEIPAKEEVSAKEEKAEPAEAPKTAESSFDPISLSQISRKTVEGIKTQDEAKEKEKAQEPEKEEVTAQTDKPEEIKKEEISISAQESSPETPKTPDIPAPAVTQEAKADEPISSDEKKDTPISAETESGIYNKLNELTQNSMSKSDLSNHMEPINNKLSQIDQTISSMENNKLSGEIKEMSSKLKHMEDIIEEIKLNMSVQRKPVEEPAQQKEASQRDDVQQGFAAMGQEPVKAKESAEDIARAVAKENKSETEISDEGSNSADKAKKPSKLKALARPLITVVLLAAVLVATAIALKKAGIIDFTKMLPFAALTGGQSQTPAPVQVPEKLPPQVKEEKDIKPEIIFFTRTYSNKNGSKTIENQIINMAAQMKADTNLIEWQATKITEGVYAVHAIVPVPSKQSKINYIFEVDYNKKTMKPLNTQAKTVLDNLFKIIKPKKKAAPKKKRARNTRKSSRKKQTYKKPVKKTVKPKVKKPVAPKPAEDDYEYVYEDEYEDEGDYILPGVPAFGN
ncbi:MAG: hypothetical protein U9Q34_04330 [Elusimicrobiota bacterium]|nr:hypothetical protein [Elusimicrobiota bacterium]